MIGRAGAISGTILEIREAAGKPDVKDGHITLEDVAKRARVSTSTVSRFLSGLKINKKNHDRVQKAVAELGYVMNEAARSLRNVKTMTVGLAFHELTGIFGIELLSSISSRFDAQGYCVFVATAQGDSERYDKLIHRFLERRVDALFCVNAAGTGASLDRYLSAEIPVLGVITKREGYSRLPLIAPTVAQASKICLQSLIAKGHRRVMVLRSARRPLPIEQFLAVAKTCDIDVRIEVPSPDGPFDPTRILELCRTDAKSPTVVVAMQAEAAQMLAAAERMGIAVPQSLSIVAIRDRSPQVFATRQQLSMIYLDPQKLGAAAADRILAQLAGGSVQKQDSWAEIGSWLEHDTTANAPGFVPEQAGARTATKPASKKDRIPKSR